MEREELILRAKDAMGRAYAPYSGFRVGAALLCADGTVYTGCNIENASYGATNCAERTAIFTAVAAGHRSFTAIAICGGHGGVVEDYCMPCGICRQVLSEFCPPDTHIHIAGPDGIRTYTLEQLLPGQFQLTASL